MKITHTETVHVERVTDVLCDRCGKSMLGSLSNVNGVSISGSGAYDSTHFPDGIVFTADVCEGCAAEWFKTFKHNPLDTPIRDFDPMVEDPDQEP
jgi:hypothetical protein